jgi:hypothetical protein
MEPVRYRHRVLELKVSFLENPWRYGANIANDTSRDADDNCMIGHIAGDNRAGTDQGFSPMVMPGRIVALLPIEARGWTLVGMTLQSPSVRECPFAVVARGQLSLVTHHAVPDEDLIGDLDTLANKAVR